MVTFNKWYSSMYMNCGNQLCGIWAFFAQGGDEEPIWGMRLGVWATRGGNPTFYLPMLSVGGRGSSP
eukprot:3117364-Lingulodinium_polyedra.AAC.1